MAVGKKSQTRFNQAVRTRPKQVCCSTDDGQINLTFCLFASLPARSSFKISDTVHLPLSHPIFSKTGKEPRRSGGSQYRLIAARHPRRRRNVSSLCNNRVSVSSSCGFDHLLWHKMCWIRWIFVLWWRVCDFCCLVSHWKSLLRRLTPCRFLCLPPFVSSSHYIKNKEVARVC